MKYGYSYLFYRYFNPFHTCLVFLHFIWVPMYILNLDVCTWLSGFTQKVVLRCIVSLSSSSFMTWRSCCIDAEFVYVYIMITCYVLTGFLGRTLSLIGYALHPYPYSVSRYMRLGLYEYVWYQNKRHISRRRKYTSSARYQLREYVFIPLF